MKFNKLTKMLIAVVAMAAICMPSTANAKTLNDKSGQDKKIIFKSVEETDKGKLFDKAKSESTTNKKDENGNKIYETKQQLEVYKDQNGQECETVAVTSFKKIENKSTLSSKLNGITCSLNSVLSSSKGDGSWDPSGSAYLYSTIYYTNSSSNGRNYVKLDSASGGVSNLNSGVNLYSLSVTIGCVGIGATSQTKTVSCSSSFNLSAPSSWVPVPAVYGQWGSMVGCTMNSTLGRSSSSTWTYQFVNKL